MIDQLSKDRLARPDLFHFFGAIHPEKLDRWLAERELLVPPDLKEFWCETGGGDLFESETILGPFGPADTGDDFGSVNQRQRQNGMRADWWVIHTGLGLTVVKMLSGEYANLRQDSYEVQRTFRSLEEWYQFIRKEYGPRYGLL